MYTEAKTECRQVIFSSHFHTLLGFSEKAVAKHPLCGNLRVQRPNITLSTINVALRKLKEKKKKNTEILLEYVVCFNGTSAKIFSC